MESTENEPVLNVDELNSGQELTESAGDNLENNEEVASESTNNNSENNDDDFEIEAFDPKAFAAREEKEEEEEEKVNTEEEDDIPAWPDIDEVESSKEEEKEKVVSESSEPVSENENNKDSSNEEVTQDHFKSFTNQLGLEAENIEELKEVLNSIVEELSLIHI